MRDCNKPELLAPAGDLEKLKWAVAYGADAVYFGAEFGSLRSFAGNFNFDDAEKGINHLHENNRKGYVTLNIYPFSEEYDKLTETAKTLDDIGADAFIVADLGVLNELKKLGLNANLHISTQANTTSSQTVAAYKELGATRVNLARELSIDRIKRIQQDIAGQIETEVFIHGSVCFSYSGRCAISDYLTGFRANHGECKHPCRWKYSLVEEKRPGEHMPVYEDDRGLYFFNTKELALFPFVPQLIEAGVKSFKIEGRMKSIHYIATAVSFYRKILDGKKLTWQEGLDLLYRIPNRGYSQGFMKGEIEEEDYDRDKSGSYSNSRFVGNILAEKKDSCSMLEVRNSIHAGEELEVLTPDGNISSITLPTPLTNQGNQQLDTANRPQTILIEKDLPQYTVLRRVDVN
jgi:putative protease